MKNYTPEMASLWRKMLGQRPYDAVAVALEIRASESPFFPRPYDILQKIAGKGQQQVTISTTARVEELQKQEREFDAVRQADLKFYKKINREEKEAAAHLILERNPIKSKSLKAIGLEHPGWRAMILRLIRDGIIDKEEVDV